MISRREIVSASFRVAQNRGNEQRQHRRDADCDNKVCTIAQFAYERPAQKRAKLRPLIVPAKREAFPLGGRNGQRHDRFLTQRDLFDILD